MFKKRKSGCFPKILVLSIVLGILLWLGILKFEVFAVTGEVLETIEPNIDYVYTNLGTNEYGQPEENFEIINKKYQTDNVYHMFTIGHYPSPGETVNYFRLKIFLKWPIYKILWLNFVY